MVSLPRLRQYAPRETHSRREPMNGATIHTLLVMSISSRLPSAAETQVASTEPSRVHCLRTGKEAPRIDGFRSPRLSCALASDGECTRERKITKKIPQGEKKL